MNHPAVHHRQSGMLLIAAIILITTVASAVALLATTMTTRSMSTARTIEATQAYYAAYSSVQYALLQVRSGNCLLLPPALDIQGFEVTFTCKPQLQQEADQDYTVFTLTAHAQRGDLAAGSLVSRRMQVTVCVVDDSSDLSGCLERP